MAVVKQLLKKVGGWTSTSEIITNDKIQLQPDSKFHAWSNDLYTFSKKFPPLNFL